MRALKLLLILCVFVWSNVFSQTQISPFLFGQNAWMPDSIGQTKYWGQLDNMWSYVKDCNIKLLRVGGIAYDENPITHYQIIKLIDSIRTIGAEPLIQVSFNNGDYTPSQAADFVNFVNNISSKNIIYWSIANEPVLSYSASATEISQYFKAFASAMKQVDVSIKIVGPDLAWYNQSIFNQLIGGSNDITGTDENGNYYLDIVSFHTYPFDGSQSKNDIIEISNTYIEPSITDLLSKMHNANVLNNRLGNDTLNWAITEFNINYGNPSDNTVIGLGTNSFINGQLWAELFGLGIKYNVEFMCPWSIHESGGTASSSDLGFINGGEQNTNPRSSYFHEQLLAQNIFNYYANYYNNISGVKTFGTYSNDSICVAIINMNNQAYNYELSHNSTNSSLEDLQINSNTLNIQNSFVGQRDANCTQLLVFNNTGDITRTYTYCEGDLEPEIYNFPTNTLLVNNSNLINIYPNPFNGYLRIKNENIKTEDIKIFNLIGQDLSWLLSINKTKQAIKLNTSKLPKGMYVLQMGSSVTRVYKE